MKAMNKPRANEIELGQVFEQSKNNAKQIDELRSDLGTAISELRQSIDRLGTRLTSATAPNFSTMAAWAGILLTIIGMVAAPVAYYFNTTLGNVDSKLQKEYGLINETMNEKVIAERKSLEDLDLRLQREFLTANQTTKETATVLKESWSERQTDLVKRVAVLEDWNYDRIKADLEELRQRRMKDKP